MKDNPLLRVEALRNWMVASGCGLSGDHIVSLMRDPRRTEVIVMAWKRTGHRIGCDCTACYDPDAPATAAGMAGVDVGSNALESALNMFSPDDPRHWDLQEFIFIRLARRAGEKADALRRASKT